MSLLDTASLVITPNGYKAGTLYSVVPNTTLGDMTVTRSTSATRVNSAGLIESVGNNVPRLDYSNGTCPSILVEPQRTNLVTYSEDFSNISQYISINGFITTNQILSPSGLQNADLFTKTSSGGYLNMLSLSSLGNNKITVSIFVKKGNTSIFKMQESYYFGIESTFDLNNGTVLSGNGKIENFGNDWYRCSLTVSYGISQNQINYIFFPLNIGTLYMWGLQVEEGSYATSYIPTTSASVTRNADVISKTGISSLIGQTEGVLYADFYYNGVSILQDNIVAWINNGTYDDSIALDIINGSIIGFIYKNSVQQFQFSYAISAGRNKIAIGYKSNDIVFYINGVLVDVDNISDIPTVSRIYLGSDATGYNPQQMKHNTVALWKTRLTNAQLAELTTI